MSDHLVTGVATDTTQNKNNRRTSVPLVGFETANLRIERPQKYALDRTATGIGTQNNYNKY
jgi:hypothetical protein